MPAIQLLPIIEQWECRSCAKCCRGSIVHLDDQDLKKIRAQQWNRHPEFQNIPTVVRESWLSSRYRLAQRPDGSCVFLTEQGRCRIHELHGLDAKPLTCRMFPLQLVPREKGMLLTIRRACPTAAADEGRALKTYLDQCRKWAADGDLIKTSAVAPAICKRSDRGWDDFLTIASRMERLLTDNRYPLVRRIAHALRFCSLLEECKLGRLDARQLRELADVLCEGALDVGELFADRQPPDKAAATLFRQTAAEYVRLHPNFVAVKSWRARFELARIAVRFARGKANVPHLIAGLPEVSFDALEQPLGHLEEAVQRPFVRFFETHAMSRQFALVNRPTWTLVDSFRSLSLAFPVGLWLLRLSSVGRRPTPQDAIDVVVMLDRGQGYAPLASRQHRTRVSMLAGLHALEKLAAWYSR